MEGPQHTKLLSRGMTWIIIVLVPCVIITGCGQKESSQEPSVQPGLVSAPVNRQSVTIPDVVNQPLSAKQDRTPLYNPDADPRQDIAKALVEAKKENKRVLLQWGTNHCGWCYKLHNLFEEDADVRRQLRGDYVLVQVDSSQRNTELANSYGANITSIPFLTVLDGDNKVIVHQETGCLEEGDHHDPAKVIAFLNQWRTTPFDAEVVLKEGLERAKREGKCVFLHFGSPWCGYCIKLDRFLEREDMLPLFTGDYISVKIDVARMKGGQNVDQRFRAGGGGGIPWFAILNSDGKKLVTSDAPDGNIGFPVTPQEISHFMAMLRQTKRSLSEQQLILIETALKAEMPSKSPSAGS